MIPIHYKEEDYSVNIDELLVAYIQNNYHDIRQYTIFKALHTLNEIGLGNAEDEILTMLYKEGDIEPSTITDSIPIIITTELIKFINLNGIKLVDNIYLSNILYIIDSILNLSNNEIISMLEPIIIDDEISDVEKLSKILSISGELSPYDYLTMIENFDGELLTTISNLINDNNLIDSEEDDIVNDCDKKEILKNILTLKKMYPRISLFGFELLDSGLPICLEPHEYIKFYELDRSKRIPTIVRDILSIFVISAEFNTSFKTLFNSYADLFTDDLSLTSTLSNELEKSYTLFINIKSELDKAY